MHAKGKYSRDFIGAAIGEGSFKSTKSIYHLIHLAMESLKIYASSRSPKVRVSRAFVHKVEDGNKNVAFHFLYT